MPLQKLIPSTVTSHRLRTGSLCSTCGERKGRASGVAPDSNTVAHQSSSGTAQQQAASTLQAAGGPDSQDLQGLPEQTDFFYTM